MSTDHTVPAPLTTEGNADDYAILYGGRPARAFDAGGFTNEGYVETEINNDEGTIITVSYIATEGLQGVSARPPDNDDVTVYEPADTQPDRGTHWVPESGDRPSIKIVPESEVPA